MEDLLGTLRVVDIVPPKDACPLCDLEAPLHVLLVFQEGAATTSLFVWLKNHD
jgi:hypothetical protein